EFAFEIVQDLVARDVKLVVVACNTATAAALAEARATFRVPLVGVVEPGIRAAISATRNGLVGVIGTAGTVQSGAYQVAMEASRSGVKLIAVACPRFVEFVEAGEPARRRFLGSGEPARFEELGARFLGPEVGRVEVRAWT